jgi:hypothetical protein
MRWTLLFALSALSALATTARAQSVAGAVVSREGVPLGGVLVSVQDSAGSERGRTISTPSGGFTLRAPSGPFRVGVARIGYRRWYSAELRAEGRDTLRVRLDVDEVAHVLPELIASGPTSCRAEPGARAAVLWEEARTALSAADATLDQERIWFTVHEARRRLDQYERLVADSVLVVRLAARWPVEALPPDSLFGAGFVQPRTGPDDLAWFGPDLAVLFDPRFLERYCLRAVAGPAGSGLAGVAFAPNPEQRVPGIRGTLWFDEQSRQLRSLDFFHTRLRHWVPAGSAGGRLEFAALPDGRWLVERWRLRAPVPRQGGRRGAVLHGFLEWDASVVLALSGDRDTIWTGPPTRRPAAGESETDAGPVRIEVRELARGAREVVVRNVAAVPQAVSSVALRHCVNVLERCAEYPVHQRLPPGGRATVVVLHPWMEGRAMRFEARVNPEG